MARGVMHDKPQVNTVMPGDRLRALSGELTVPDNYCSSTLLHFQARYLSGVRSAKPH
jgi:hypothetical protein